MFKGALVNSNFIESATYSSTTDFGASNPYAIARKIGAHPEQIRMRFRFEISKNISRSVRRRLNPFSLFLVIALIAILPMACRHPGAIAQVSDPTSNAVGGGQPMTRAAYSLDWLVKNSPFVFLGRLTAIDVHRDSRGLVVSDNRFDVENTLIGTSPQKVVTLATFGGTLGNETFSASHTPEFVQGQTYVIFTDLARTTYNPITGDERGVFLVVNSEVYTYQGRAVAGVENGKFRFSSVVLEQYPGKPVREPTLSNPATTANPRVVGGVVSAQTLMSTARPMQLAEFSRLIVATKR
jgi:hypothetical protein